MVARRRRAIHPTSSLNTPSSSSSTDSLASENTAMPHRLQRAPPRFRRLSRLPVNIFIVFFAIIGSLLHCGHVAHLHENHLSFAYLSNTERELTFRSEMAFYYSFYKQIVMADTFWSGVLSLLNDTVTEYPIENEEIADWNYEKWGVLPKLQSDSKPNNGILVLERFNLYPELILAGLYRILNSLELLQSDCFQVSIDGVIWSIPYIYLYIILLISFFNTIVCTYNENCLTSFNTLTCTNLNESPYFLYVQLCDASTCRGI
ncbi:unnamed protein product [Rodentolepis nana]|uniref:Ion_trans domain-containing protein n=1 Tax=Rodentolepis nana TaxID=102285 RepID=A0A0R3TA93_RODNA|nr:unnamed protein product [Rodentolepis nana]